MAPPGVCRCRWLTSATAPTSETMLSNRDTPPAHYILKINSFSSFSETLDDDDDGMYKSDEFEAADYKWKLVVYPNGNEQRNGKGFISLYLASTDKKIISSGCHVNALVTFFVYDHIRDDYLTIQDGKRKRFNVFRTEHGFDQLLPLATFNNPSNGYVVNDCCILGVEVLVIKNKVKVNEFSFINDPPNGTFTWKIKKFSTLGSEDFYSEAFSVGGHEWKLRLCPKGDFSVRDRNMSLYLRLEENDHELLVLDANPCQSKVYVEFNLSLKDQLNGIHDNMIGGQGWLENTDTMGSDCFVLLKKLREASNGYLVNDTLVIEANITLISVSEDLTLLDL